MVWEEASGEIKGSRERVMVSRRIRTNSRCFRVIAIEKIETAGINNIINFVIICLEAFKVDLTFSVLGFI